MGYIAKPKTPSNMGKNSYSLNSKLSERQVLVNMENAVRKSLVQTFHLKYLFTTMNSGVKSLWIKMQIPVSFIYSRQTPTAFTPT